MLSLLYDPETFFAERDLRLVGPLLVVAAVLALAFVAGVVDVIVGADMATHTDPSTGTDDPFAPGGQDPAGPEPPDSEEMASLTAVGGAIGLVLGLVWLVFVFLFYAGSFHALSAFFDGEGSFTDTLAVTGWGFAPKILAEAVALAAAGYQAVVWMTSEPPAPGEAVGPIIGPTGTFLVGLVTIGALLWSAYIWYHGVREARGVDATGAAVSVGLPVFLALVFDLVVLAFSVLTVAGSAQAV